MVYLYAKATVLLLYVNLQRQVVWALALFGTVKSERTVTSRGFYSRGQTLALLRDAGKSILLEPDKPISADIRTSEFMLSYFTHTSLSQSLI